MASKLSRRADRDFRRIFVTGVELFGERQAERYAAGLIGSFEFLSSFPRAARERTEFRQAIRLHRYQSHMIVYRIVGENIEVLRVRHGREDWFSDPVGR